MPFSMPSFRPFLAALLALALLPGAVAAQSGGAVPERRLVVAEDTDFYGSDIAQLFDTTLAACQRACLTDPDCRAFTFNTRSNACFPKTEAGRIEAFAGAVSAWVRDTDAGVLARADTRVQELSFLLPSDITNARRDAEEMGTRYPAGTTGAQDLLDAAARARAGQPRTCRKFAGRGADADGCARPMG